MIEVKIIDATNKEDIKLKNEEFQLWGRMIPSYENEKWAYTVREFAPKDVSRIRFPDENYQYEEMSKNSIFIGAYDAGKCIGLAIMQEAFFKYMYLYDLKIKKAHRKQGVANMLIEKAKEVAHSKGYRGIYTQAQDNNLSACIFYVNTGFHIGGLDTKVYNGTVQEGKADILFYLDI